jgi:glycosyltransferase involved in cell wall biosynthesis
MPQQLRDMSFHLIGRTVPDRPLAAVGIWGEAAPGSRWANEGMQRLLGFLVEGAATARLPVVWRVVVPRWLAAEAETDLRSLRALPDVHWTLHAPPQSQSKPSPVDLPPDSNAEPEWVRNLATFADAEVPVDGWLILFPFLTGATLLSRPYAVILPDAIPYSFPVSWDSIYWSETGGWPLWYRRTARVINGAKKVVIFSDHVKVDIAQRLFGVPAERTAVVPHAQPDLRPHLSFLPPDGNRTSLSRHSAAGVLRAHAAMRGWRHLVDFPFEHLDYIVVSTQDRQTKNVVTVVDALSRLLRREALNLKLLMTTPIHTGADWTPLPARIATDGLELDVLSLPDLPRDVHAALYHGASLAVHASYYEGGQAPFPLHEAVSVGTPCLIASGPHTSEFLRNIDVRPYVFDPHDPLELAAAIRSVIADRSSVLRRQRSLLGSMPARNWGQVAADYVAALLGHHIALEHTGQLI